jgi:hypothetical protein
VKDEFFTVAIILWQLRQFDLYADEFGSCGIAVILQPIGVDQPRRVVVVVCHDVGKELLLDAHGGLQDVRTG